MTSTVLLGVSNMRRRKFRTVLTSTTIVLITFAVLCFTAQPATLARAPTRRAARFESSGIVLRPARFRPIPQSLVEYLEGPAAKHADCRAMVEHLAEPRQQTDLVSSTKVVAVQAVLGLSPGESDVSPIAEVVGREQLSRLNEGERNMILSESRRRGSAERKAAPSYSRRRHRR